jgi:hypothetical protein
MGNLANGDLDSQGSAFQIVLPDQIVATGNSNPEFGFHSPNA